MEEFTQEQKKQLNRWAVERDEILESISKLKSEETALKKININLSNSNTDIENRTNQAIGRLNEIEKQEESRKNLISIEVANLEKQKTALENQIPSLEVKVNDLTSQISLVTSILTNITDVHEKVFDKVNSMDKIIEHVTRVSSQNIHDIDEFMGLLKTSIQEIIDKNTKNVQSTDIILEKLPKYIFELQKPIPIRRAIVGPVLKDSTVGKKLQIKPVVK